jgi:hypothetical protein
MSLYRITPDSLSPIPSTGFSEEGLTERYDLQRLIRDHIEAIAPDCMVLAEEFSDWDDSRRRIDLLCIDTDARLVVIELKRAQTGGEMELQALRYAALVSTMTFEQAVRAHRRYLEQRGSDEDAEESLLAFLGWEDSEEEEFGSEVRIVLASQDFSKELATSVLWLNERELDITCVQIQPYRLDGEVLLDVQAVIPLPGAEDYTVRVRNRERENRRVREKYRDFTRYDVILGGQEHLGQPKRRALFLAVKHYCDRGASPQEVIDLMPRAGAGKWFELDGSLDSTQFREQAIASPRSFKERRWFFADDELVHFEGRTYAFSSQWGGKIEERIQPLIDAFGAEGDAVAPSSGESS